MTSPTAVDEFEPTCSLNIEPHSQSSSDRSFGDIAGNDVKALPCSTEIPKDEFPKKGKNLTRPNYFIAIPILNPQLKGRLAKLQQSLVELNDDVAKMLLKPETFHFTLMVFKMDDTHEDQVERAKTALDECLDAVRAELYISAPDLVVSLGGLDHFNKSILFVKPRDSDTVDSLIRASDHVKRVFQQYDLPTTDKRASKPHLTLFKPKGRPHKRTIWDTFREVLNRNQHEEFGAETLTSLQICSMLADKREDGYYEVLYERNLTEKLDSDPAESRPQLAADPGASPEDTVWKDDAVDVDAD